MDEVGIAVREERIKELEAEVRGLHEQVEQLEKESLTKDDLVRQAKETAAKHLGEYITPRDQQIEELRRENNAIRKQTDAALKCAREKQDQYDKICTWLGGQGIEFKASMLG